MCLIMIVFSIFWWTNETINIWSHIFGFALFICLTVYDLIILKIEAPLSDKILVGVILFFFQVSDFIFLLFNRILNNVMISFTLFILKTFKSILFIFFFLEIF